MPSSSSGRLRQPVILVDIMDTVVTDPFFEHMPRFFGMTFKDLLASKHPTGVEHKQAAVGVALPGSGLVPACVSYFSVFA